MSSDISPAQVLLFVDAGFFAPVVQHYRSQTDGTMPVTPGALLSWCRSDVERRLGRGAPPVAIAEARLFVPAADRTTDREAQADCIDGVFADAGFIIQKAPAGSGAAGHQLAMAVEVLDQSLRRSPDVVVLVAGFGGLSPLVRKLTGAGIAVLVPMYDVPVEDRSGATRRMRTAPALVEAATWAVVPVRGPSDRGRREPTPPSPPSPRPVAGGPNEDPSPAAEDPTPPPAGPLLGAVAEVREKMGFLLEDWNGRKLFFHHTAVVDPSFAQIGAGDRVEYERGMDPKGRACAVNLRRLAAASVTSETAPVATEVPPAVPAAGPLDGQEG